MEKNAKTFAAQIADLQIMEAWFEGLKHENGVFTFTEKMDFGLQTFARELPENLAGLYSVYCDARTINTTSPAALFALMLERKGLNYDLFMEAAKLKAKRSNSLFDLLPDYSADELAELAKYADAYNTYENNLTVLTFVQNVSVGTEIRIPNGQTGFTYGVVIFSAPDGLTVVLTEQGISGLFTATYEQTELPETLREEVLKGLQKWAENLTKRKENMAVRAEKRVERAKAIEAKTAEQAQKRRAKILDFCAKYDIEIPATFEVADFEAVKAAADLKKQEAKEAKAAEKAAKAEAAAKAKEAKAAEKAAKAEAKAEAKAAAPKQEKKAGKKAAANIPIELLAEAAANALGATK